MKLFISAGEASGDLYGAALLREMRRLGLPPDLKVQAMGGRRIRAEGAEIVADSSRWGAIGIAQAFRVGFRVLFGLISAKKAIGGDQGLLIAIDFGFVNVRLARHAKRSGWKVLYFLPPGSWRRDRQGGDLPGLTDAVSTPFSWSAELLQKAGANAHWFGHPIRQIIKEDRPAQGARTTLAILPGSRKHEIELNVPLIAQALKSRPEVFEFGVAQTVDKAWLAGLWAQHTGRPGDRFTEGDLYGVLGRAKAAVVCSGTATLEAALCGCPMVVVYKLTRAMHLEGYLMGLKRQFISLPNILLQRGVVPELASSVIDPSDLRVRVDGVLDDEAAREKQRAGFKELEEMLGPEDAVTRTAELALSLLGHAKA